MLFDGVALVDPAEGTQPAEAHGEAAQPSEQVLPALGRTGGETRSEREADVPPAQDEAVMAAIEAMNASSTQAADEQSQDDAADPVMSDPEAPLAEPADADNAPTVDDPAADDSLDAGDAASDAPAESQPESQPEAQPEAQPQAQAPASAPAAPAAPAFSAAPGAQTGREDTAFEFGTIFDTDVDDAGRTSLLTEGPTWDVEVRVVSGNGVINDGNVSDREISSQGDREGINRFLAGLKFSPDADWSGDVSIRITVRNYADASVAPVTLDFALKVQPAADRPETGAVPQLAAIAEDTLDARGATVASLLPNFRDADGDRLAGLAISANGATAAQGSWEYSTDDGASWRAVGSVSRTSALMLDASARLRFAPAENWFGTPGGLTVHAVDDSGARGFTSGATRQLSSVSAGSDVDSVGASLGIRVTPVNDAPVTSGLALAVDKNGSLAIALTARDPDRGTNTSTDAAVTRFVIHDIAGLNGTLRIDGGAVVTAGMELTAAQAAKLRFTPTANFSGAASFTFQAFDAAGAASGISTASISVTALNEVPTVTVPGPLALLEDAGPVAVSGIVVADRDGGDNTEQVTLQASHGVLSLVDTTGLEVSGDGSGRVILRGTLDALNAALAGLRYTSDADYHGLDNITVTIDDLGNSGPAPASASATIGVTVASVADAPVTGEASLAPIVEDTLDPPGAPVADLLGGFFDADGDLLAGIAISFDASAPGQGQWQYSVDSGASWLAVGSVSRDAALALDTGARLRFVPGPDFNGRPGGLTIHAIDASGARAFSSDGQRVTLAIAPAADIDAVGAELGTVITPDADGLQVDVNRGLRVAEGGSAVLTGSVLTISSRDAGPADVVYTILASGTALEAGQLSLGGVLLRAGDTFTQADIDAGRIRYSHDGREPSAQGIAYSVSDGISTEQGRLAINVTPVNDAPVLYVPGDTTPGGALLAANVAQRGDAFTFSRDAIRVIDPDNGAEQLVFRIEGLPAHGTLTLDGAAVLPGVVFNYADLGKLVYTHDGGAAAGDSFRVSLRDGAGGVVGATTVTLTIGSANHAPTGIGDLNTVINEDPDSYGAAKNSGTAIRDLAGYLLVDVDPGASVGGIAVVGNSADPSTQGHWEYRSADGQWAAIGAVNDHGAALVLAADTLVRFVPVADYHGEPGALQIRVLDNTYAGAVSSTVGGEQRVLLDTSSGQRGGSSAISDNINRLGVSVVAVNDDPILVANRGLEVTAPGETVTIGSGQLAAIDPEGDTITYLVETAPSHGVLLLDGKPIGEGASFTQTDIDSGRLQYRNIDGVKDGFTVTVRDGKYNTVLDRPGGIYAGDALARIEVPVDIVPDDGETPGPGPGLVVRDDALVTRQDTAILANPAANDGGVGQLTIIAVDQAVNGAVTLEGGLVRFTPAAGFSGTAYYEYTVRDEAGNTASARVTVYVLANNEAPTLVQAPLQLDEGAVATITAGHLDARDRDNLPSELTYSLIGLAGLTNGALYYDAGGTPTTLGSGARRLHAGDSFTQQDVLEGRIKFMHDGGEDFISSFTFRLTDGAARLDREFTFDIDVNPLNDRPDIAGGTVNVVKGGSVTIDGAVLQASDVDGIGSDKSSGHAAPDTLSFRIDAEPLHGELRLVVEGEVYDAADPGTWRKVDTSTVLNAADLARGLVYVHTGDGTAADSIGFIVDDGSGADNSSNSAPVTIRIVPVNAYPVVVVDTGLVLDWDDDTLAGNGKALYEGQGRTLAVSDLIGDGDLLELTDLLGMDPDNGPSQIQFRITENVLYGELTRDGQLLGAGSAFTVQDLIDGLIRYQHDGLETPVASGPDVHSDFFSYVLSDGSGGNGDDGVNDPDRVEPRGRFNIDIMQVNDTPTVSVPGARIGAEDKPLAVPGIVVLDPDSRLRDGSIDPNHGPMKVTLSVGHGTLSLTGSGELAIGGNGSATLVLTGTQGEINAALATLVYQGDRDYNGLDRIDVLVDDLGRNGVDPDLPDVPGSGDGSVDTNETARASVNITLQPVDDAPVHALPGRQALDEDTTLSFGAAHGNAIVVSDVDAGDTPGATLTTTVSVGHGTLTVSAGHGAIAANGTASVTITGTLDQINAALDGMVYRPTADYNGADTLTIVTNDRGNTGLGGPLSTRDTVGIDVAPVNDAPLTDDLAFTVAEDTVLTFDLASREADGGTGGDGDADVDRYRILSVPDNGVLRTGDGIVIDGPTVISLAQATGMTFTPNADFNRQLGSVEFAFTALDSANAESEPAVVRIDVTPVNDAPVLAGGGDGVAYTEGLGKGVAGTPVLLDANHDFALARDVELTLTDEDDFGGSSLVIARQGGAVASDRFAIDTAFDGDGNSVGLNGSVVSVNGRDVADLAGGAGTLTLTFRTSAGQEDVSALMKRITFSSVADDLPGTIKVDVTFDDGNAGTPPAQGSGGALAATATFSVTVTGTNDAPAASSAVLAPVGEDAGAAGPNPNSGNLAAAAGATVGSLFGERFTDPDAPGGVTAAGIAIVDNAATEAQGRWQFSLDGGQTWNDVPREGLGESGALVLGSTDRLRFHPDQANYNGAVGALTVRLSDGNGFVRSSSGADLQALATGSTDGWSNRTTLETSVAAVNDGPVIRDLDGDQVVFIEAVGVNIAGSAVLLDNALDGKLRASLVDVELTDRREASFAGATLVVQNHGSPDLNDFFVVQNGVNGISTSGSSTQPGPDVKLFNNGSAIRYNGVHVATIVDNSAASGRLELSFTADATGAAVDAILQNLAYSNNNDALEAQLKKIDVTFSDGNKGAQGSGGPLSATAQVLIDLKPSNDAPSFTAGATIATVEDAAPVARTIDSLLGANFRDPDGVAGNFAGVAIAGFDNAGLGDWQVRLGGEWVDLAELAPQGLEAANALLLAKATEVRFVANEHANTDGAGRPSISVYAVENLIPVGASDDNAPALAFSTAKDALQLVDTTRDTLESRVSENAVTLDVTIAARNDAPLLPTNDGRNAAFSGDIVESAVAGIGTAAQQLVSNAWLTDLDLESTGRLADGVFGAGTITVSLERGVNADRLSLAGTPAGIASVSGGADGASLVIRLAQTATLEQVNRVLEAIRYEHTGDTPPAGTRAYTITVSDGNNQQAGGNAGGPGTLSASINGAITIVQANDPPLVDLNGDAAGTDHAVTWIEAANGPHGALVIVPDAFLEDTDNANLVSMSVTIGGVKDGNHEVLTIGGHALALGTDVAGLEVGGLRLDYDSASGTMRFVPAEGATASLASVQALLKGITYNNLSDDPTAGARTISIEVVDAGMEDDGADTPGNDLLPSNRATVSVSVVPVNDQPRLSGLDKVTFHENRVQATPAWIDRDITLVDVDNVDYGGATITVSGLAAGDIVSLPAWSAGADAAANPGAVLLRGTTIVHSDGAAWTEVGSASGGHGASLVLELNAHADATIAEHILEHLTFALSSDAPQVTRTLVYTVDDGAGGPGLVVGAPLEVTVVRDNDAPSMSATRVGGAYTEGGAPLFLVGGAIAVADADIPTGNLDGGALTVKLDQYVAGDRLAIVDGGNASGQVGAADGVLRFGGVAIGSYAGGLGADLVVTLNDKATPQAVRALLAQLTFSSTSDDPSAGTGAAARGLGITLSDGGNVSDAGADVRGPLLAELNGVLEVVATADAPQLAAGNASFTENGGAVALSPGLSLADRDDTHASGATVRISAGLQAASDRLVLAGAVVGETIAGTAITFGGYDAASGTLTLSGVDTLANYQAVLRQVGFDNLSEDPTGAAASATRTITWSVADADAAGIGAATGTTTSTVTLHPVNDAPTLALGAVSPQRHVQGGAAVVIDANASLGDLELDARDDWSGATLGISRAGGASGDDLFGAGGALAFADGRVLVNGVDIGGYVQSGGSLVMTFGAGATGEAVDAALRGLTYANTRVAPGALDYDRVLLRVTVDDRNGDAGPGQQQGADGSLTASGDILLHINRLPVAGPGSGDVSEGIAPEDSSSTSGDVIAGAGDSDDDVLTVAGVAAGNGAPLAANVGEPVAGTYGSLRMEADGSYVYTLDNTLAGVQALAVGEQLSETFTFAVADGRDGVVSSTLTIVITGTNDAPLVTTAELAGSIAEPVKAEGVLQDSGTIGFGDVDLSDEHTVSVKPQGTPLGSLAALVTSDTTGSGVDGAVRWTYSVDAAAIEHLALGETRVERFDVTIADGKGGLVTRTVEVTISGSNDAPVLLDTVREIAQLEDAPAPGGAVGALVADLLGPDGSSDVDGKGAQHGIALTGVDASKGQWLVSFDDGVSWEGVGTVGEDAALLLGPTARLYFQPLPDANTGAGALAAGLTFRAWDRSSGAEGASVAIGTPGGGSAYSSASDTVALRIVPVNDGPAIIGLDAVSVNASPGNPYLPEEGPVVIDPDVRFEDRELGIERDDWNGASLVLERAGGASADDLFGARAGGPLVLADGVVMVDGVAIGSYVNGGGTLSMTFDAGATTARVDLAAQNITYANAATLPDYSSVTLDWRLVDGNSNTDGGGVAGAGQDQGRGGSLQALAQIEISLNQAPVAEPDSAIAVEAGGIKNAGAGIDPSGNVLENDRDPDRGDTKTVTTPGTFTGRYGTLVLAADGSYTYTVDNALPDVERLRLAGDTLTDSFDYTMADKAGLTSSSTLTITIRGANDAPVAVSDSAVAVEAGGIANASAGVNPTGNVLDNDTDIDAGDSKTVVSTGVLAGIYGSLTLEADGSYRYTVDNAHPAVQALRTSGDTLLDTIVYTMADAAGATSSATLTITIRGANDAPVAVNDSAIAVEAGGVANGSAGIDPSGNVLANDGDVDAGDSKAVVVGTGVRVGAYGALSLAADGSYTYVVDNDHPAVQALRGAGDTLRDSFTYTMMDAAGATSSATLTVTIRGANDAPVAMDDVAIAVEAGAGGAGIDPSGNVLDNDTDIDAGDSRTVASTGVLAGAYGSLTLAADGSYTYVLDNDNPLVQGLRAGDTLLDAIGYTMRDAAGATSSATLTITIRGANDAPIAVDDSAVAVEAGGVANGTPGSNPRGNVLGNDRDVDAGDGVTVVSTGVLAGAYGSLTLGADGSYTYVLDNDHPAVQALRTPGDTLVERIAYTVRDGHGAESSATLVVTIRGANDAPVARDDGASALESGGLDNAIAGRDASGNVLDNDSDVDAGDGKAVVTVGSFTGAYGVLVLEADGSYVYRVDQRHPAVEGLAAGQSLTERFAYTMRDTDGLTHAAVLVVTIEGSDDVLLPQQADSSLQLPPATDTSTRPLPPDASPAGELIFMGGYSSSVRDFVALPFQIEDGLGRLQLRVSLEVGQGWMGAGYDFDARKLESVDRGFPVERLKMEATADTTVEGQQKGGERLFTFKGIGNTSIAVGRMLDYHVPNQAFGHTDPAAIVQLEALLVDGNPLPEWVEFDPTSGVFGGRPPKDAVDLEIKVIARDNEGREATTTFRLRIEGAEAQAVETAGMSDVPAQGKDVAKRGATAFSEQIKLARRADPLLDSLMSLVAPAKPAADRAADNNIQKTSA